MGDTNQKTKLNKTKKTSNLLFTAHRDGVQESEQRNNMRL